MALSDQLSDLANRTKRLEDTAAAAEAQNRAKLESEREKLHTTVQKEAKNLDASAKRAGNDVRSWWSDMTGRMEQQRAELRGRIEEQKAERKVESAQRNAKDAESYASDMMTLAAYVIDVAEYAVVDASLARSQADELASAR